MTEPEQIDKDIDISSPIDPRKRNGGPRKRKASGIVWILSIFAIGLIVILILPSGDSISFNTDMSSEEQELRDMMYSIACDIHEYYQLNGRLPLVPEEIDISAQAITYTAEDDSSWFLQSGDSLIYYSDMDPMEFAKGEI
ncbi:MAG: hypothetical protein KAQ97_05400 [Candidatus Fermentibacteraceae bacterium]|nr:hypothetical protein [Candidatus Fermentibacteraceae bacterium]